MTTADVPTRRLSTHHPDGATELHLAMTEQVMAELRDILLPQCPDRAPERGVIGVLHVSRGCRRRTLLLRRVVLPRPGDVRFHIRHCLLFSETYKSRAADEATGEDGGLLFLHTHPVRRGREDSFPHPSPEDLEVDPRDLYALGRSLGHRAPLAAGILSDTGLWSVREYSFRFPRTLEEVRDPLFSAEAAVMTYVSAVRIVGPSLRKLPTSVGAEGPAGAEGGIALDAQDSTVQLWGTAGQRALASVRVGLTGAGGVGGILAEHVARLGVGGLVGVDYDRLTRENLNRSQGATREEAAAYIPKVRVAERLARAAATAPSFEFTAIDGSVIEEATIPHLLDCDIILNVADSPWARQVLDHLAFAHLIPVVQGGTVLKGDPATGRVLAGKSEVSATGTGHPCSECAGVYTRHEVTEAQEHPSQRGHRGYLDVGTQRAAEEARAPSVIALNAIVAGLMELRLMALVLGTTPDALVGAQRYHVVEGTMDWSLVHGCREGCARTSTIGLGDRHALPTGVDQDRLVSRERETRLVER